MGSGYSQEDYEAHSLKLYELALQHSCLLPDVSIDESLLKYSGTDSNAVLQAYTNELVSKAPNFIEKFGSAFGAISSVPNAVGLGALVISMIIELITMSHAQRQESTYSILRRVFGEEKASSVRDTMSEYLGRHRIFINNKGRLLSEIRRLEVQLSNHLTILKNSLSLDGQMSSRGFKIWVNGASFHLQMLIHEARLNPQTGELASDRVHEIENAINLYLLDLDMLLEKYRTYRISSTVLKLYAGNCIYLSCSLPTCGMKSEESKCEIDAPDGPLCVNSRIETYINLVFSKEPIASLRSHFSNIKSNLRYLINQHGPFTLPTAG